VTEAGRIAAATEELALAREELSAADHLIAAKLPRVALGRAYFAAFHACRAILYARGLEPLSMWPAVRATSLDAGAAPPCCP